MISLWADEAGRFTMTNFLANRGAPLRDCFAICSYDWRPFTAVSRGPHIFGALDQLTASGRAAVARLYDQLATLQPGVPLLNDPRRCLLRHSLLERLAAEGLNNFRAYPVNQANELERFPVFIRESFGHNGSLTPLLGSTAELRHALLSLRLRGYSRADLLIVEFCDTSAQSGIFRKYAAFKVGETIIPGSLMIGRDWVLKTDSAQHTLEWAREELAYVEANPYAAWLRRVFALAGVDYGRIDYGVLGGRPQAWEINLNPTLGGASGVTARQMEPQVAEWREHSRRLYYGRLREAFAALDPADLQRSFVLTLEPACLARLAREHRQLRRRKAAWAFFRATYRRMRAPIRALRNRLITAR